MPATIALLRAINVGGRNKLPMADLRHLFESLGFAGARTLLQSGNVVFDAGRRKAGALEKLLEKETKSHFDLDIDYVVRTAAEWKKVISDNPFPKDARRDPSRLLVMFTKTPPASTAVKALQTEIKGPERIRAIGRQLYIVYAAGIAKSKLTNTLIERRLNVRGTARNWNTILKLEAQASNAT